MSNSMPKLDETIEGLTRLCCEKQISFATILLDINCLMFDYAVSFSSFFEVKRFIVERSTFEPHTKRLLVALIVELNRLIIASREVKGDIQASPSFCVSPSASFFAGMPVASREVQGDIQASPSFCDSPSASFFAGIPASSTPRGTKFLKQNEIPGAKRKCFGTEKSCIQLNGKEKRIESTDDRARSPICYTHHVSLEKGLHHIIEHENSFLTALQSDDSRKVLWYTFRNYKDCYVFLKDKTFNFVDNYQGLYEVIPPTRRVKIYVDSEWNLTETPEIEIFTELREKFESFVKSVILPNAEFYWSTASSFNKASYHCVVGGGSYSQKKKIKLIMERFQKWLPQNSLEKLTINGRFVIDYNVYSDRTQQYRMLYATKKEKNENGHFIQRPFLPLRPVNKSTFGNWLAQVLPSEEEHHKPLDTTPSKKITPRKRSTYRPSENFDINLNVVPEQILRTLHNIAGRENILKSSTMGGNIRVFTRFKFCVIKGAYHGSNNVFFDINPNEMTIHQGCHNCQCAAKYYSPHYERPNLIEGHPLLLATESSAEFEDF